MGELAASRIVASFDSATALQLSVAAALRGENFPHLGQGSAKGALVRAAGRIPWAWLRHIYTRIGAAEGIPPHRLADVDMSEVAGLLADRQPHRRHPAVMIGSSNGAMAHLAAAMQVPWLPGTTLVPVSRRGDPARPDEALRFGERVAPDLLARNPDVVLHQMHDQVQDELMVARMAYFRLKWRNLPVAYARYLQQTLAPGAPVILVEDSTSWPVTRVGERHVFQTGALGGMSPEAYLVGPHAPPTTERAAEAEWGAEPGFSRAVAQWCAEHGHPLITIGCDGPQELAHPVAMLLRQWFAARGETTDRLVVPSFAMGDPWQMITTASVPFWTFFPVRSALSALVDHLAAAEPYSDVHLLMFQHGVDSVGRAPVDQWLQAVRDHGAEPHLVGLDPRRAPHDIGHLGSYGPALRRLPRARELWHPLDPLQAATSLSELGVEVTVTGA